MARRRKRARQQIMDFPSWGGPRKGAGRPPTGKHAGVSHLRRGPLAARYPVHVTMRLKAGLPGLRAMGPLRVLMQCFYDGREREGFRLVHYAVLGNHIHMLVEGKDRESLARGLQGLAVRVAKGLNRFWKRSGTVFADRYHDRILRTPREVKNALVYILRNARHHRTLDAGATVDHHTSGPWFDGWARGISARIWRNVPAPVAQARTWLLSKGWRKHGLLRLGDIPAG